MKGSADVSTTIDIEMRKKKDVDSDDDPDFEDVRINPLTENNYSSNNSISKRSSKSLSGQLNRTNVLKEVSFEDLPFGWPKAASSVDRLSKISITLSFVFFLSIKLSVMF